MLNSHIPPILNYKNFETNMIRELKKREMVYFCGCLRRDEKEKDISYLFKKNLKLKT